MERGSFQGIAAGLERILENTRFDLRRAIDQFQELCLIITAERNIPTDIITDVRQTYKKIQDQLTKINMAKQLLEGKYRQFYHRDHQREREVMEFAFLAKTLYSKFEYTLQEIEAKKKLKGRGEYFVAVGRHTPFRWFQSAKNQIILLRNLESLRELEYKTRFELGFERRREEDENGIRSISLFTLLGEAILIDNLQSSIRLRDYDIIERYTEEEFRGALTHLREIPLSEVERVIRRFMDSSEFLGLKCLLLRIRSPRDLEKEIIASTDNVLQVMGRGEVKTLSI